MVILKAFRIGLVMLALSTSEFPITASADEESVAGATADQQAARLTVRITDRSGRLVPARAWVDVEGQRLYQPVEPETATPYRQDQSFSCDGQFTMLVPPGRANVHVEKGKEFLAAEVEIEASAGQLIQREIVLERWIHMAQQGWYSADMHVHLGFDNPRILEQLALADDVNLIPAFTYWLRGKGETWHSSWPDKEYLLPIVIDATHVITRNNLEIERIDSTAEPAAAVGATFLFNLQQPITAEKYGEHFPTDAELCAIGRAHSVNSVFDSDKPSWAETVVGAALGQLDTIQVCHNHYHRNQTLPGGWGMVGPLSPGESNLATGDGLFHRTNALYYRLLNCGFRLGVSGGSAIGVMPVPAGYNRLYAKLEGPFTAEKMWSAIKAGKTFATSGPLLWLSANGLEAGETLAIASGEVLPVLVEARVRSSERLESLEIVRDGLVVAAADLRSRNPTPTLQAELNVDLTAEHSGWLAARALYRAPDGLLRQAHTSPIYLHAEGRPLRPQPAAGYMLQWIDRLIAVAEQHPEWYPSQAERAGVMATYHQARQVYAALAGPRQR